jgi:hypothetical protein
MFLDAVEANTFFASRTLPSLRDAIPEALVRPSISRCIGAIGSHGNHTVVVAVESGREQITWRTRTKVGAQGNETQKAQKVASLHLLYGNCDVWVELMRWTDLQNTLKMISFPSSA